MFLQRQPKLTPEEYLALERTAEYKSEYYAGELLALAGASERHISIVANTMLNPTVLIEVLFESTEAYDRGKKFDHYRPLASASDYLLISQDQHQIEHFVRQPDNGKTIELNKETGLADGPGGL